MADQVMILPGVRRLEGKRVTFTSGHVADAYRTFRSVIGLIRS